MTPRHKRPPHSPPPPIKTATKYSTRFFAHIILYYNDYTIYVVQGPRSKGVTNNIILLPILYIYVKCSFAKVLGNTCAQIKVFYNYIHT